MSIKQKTTTGLYWSFIDSFSGQAITFIVGIILARILSPNEYGLIGMITVFIAVSQSFVDGGFGSALIRKKDCTEKDYSTVFYFNLISGFLFFWILFFFSSRISDFYTEPQLKILIRVLACVVIIDSVSIIQRTTLTKKIDFKLQTKISIISNIISGAVGITMALQGFGVWSLVVKNICQRTISSVLLWIWNKWKPLLVFDKKSFTELFSIGSKLLISSFIDTIYNNIYYLIIGKYFSAKELGFYSKADQFQKLPSSNISGIISRVSLPILATIQDDEVQLKASFKRLFQCSMLISFVLMLGMVVIAEPLVITLIGEKWRPCIIYLQMLSFIGMQYPMHSLNLNALVVKGRTDLFLKIEIIKKIMAIPIIIAGIAFGIKAMIGTFFILSIAAYFVNAFWSGKMIKYPIHEQLLDIIPSFAIAVFTAVVVYSAGYLITCPYIPKLILEIISVLGITMLLCEIFRLQEYIYIKSLVHTKLKTYLNGRKQKE